MSHDEDVRQPSVRDLFVMLDYALQDLHEDDPAHGYLSSLHRITDALMEERERIPPWLLDPDDEMYCAELHVAHDKVEGLLRDA